MIIRPARLDDAPAMSAFLQELSALGKRTRRSDLEFVQSHYVENPSSIRCSVAEDADGTILGFQALTLAGPDNEFGVEAGWGVIGTHVSPHAARRGVGRALFSATREAAQSAGLRKIDASIGDDNAEGLAYYEAMGFRTYRMPEGRICKCYEVS
ncbi:GNAT family N-acetyltransferase [Thalassococcus sp. S3]|uniref:GNAT family N-acetyltransferase n=1 Tax=Thalassococcus sp. S3 TaxID=2017482 RepID=UPI0010246BF9|nr:GNAT family N-acetyltransferase [Thalassococcus sp. S3]QBF31141.1 GNAT family N-acetyltransferase [Thalassococcus sp. S3]